MKKAAYILVGSFLAAVALNLFLLPSGIAPGGMSGVATILYVLSDGLFPVGLTTLVLNIPLFITGGMILGKSFAAKSVLGTVLFSVMIDVTSYLVPFLERFLSWEAFANGMEHPQGAVTTDYLLYSVWGGLLLGLGLGLIFRGGATTGGTDIAARLLQRRLSWLSLGQLVLFMDILFLVLVGVCFGSVIASLYTGVVVFVSSQIIDVVEAGVNYAKEITIITHHPDAPAAIAKEVMDKLERGVTKMNGQGMYTGEDVSILLCVIYNKQLPSLKKIVSRWDPDAFVVVSDVRDVSTLHGSNKSVQSARKMDQKKIKSSR